MIRCAWCDRPTDDFAHQDGWACCGQSCAYSITCGDYALSAYAQRVRIQQERMRRGEPWWRGSETDPVGLVIPPITDDPEAEAPPSAA
jgi:hypothetical protein